MKGIGKNLVKEIISFKNGSRFCFSVKENNLRDFYKKAIEINDLPNSPLYQVPGYRIPKSRYIKGRVDVFIEDSPHQWKALNLAGIPCLLIDGDNNKEYGPFLKIYTLSYDEIEDVYYLAKELGIFKEFSKYI